MFTNVTDQRLTAGKRLDNRACERPGHPGQPGVRFFLEDEDEFGLEDLLQASHAAPSSCQACCPTRRAAHLHDQQ